MLSFRTYLAWAQPNGVMNRYWMNAVVYHTVESYQQIQWDCGHMWIAFVYNLHRRRHVHQWRFGPLTRWSRNLQMFTKVYQKIHFEPEQVQNLLSENLNFLILGTFFLRILPIEITTCTKKGTSLKFTNSELGLSFTRAWFSHKFIEIQLFCLFIHEDKRVPCLCLKCHRDEKWEGVFACA